MSLSRHRDEAAIPEVERYGSGPPSRSRSRVGVGFEDEDDPAGVPLPPSMAPSRATSAGYDYGTARSRSTGTGGRSTGTGLSTPYNSRRLEPHPEDDYDNEIVPSSDDSANTLTTPPGVIHPLPPPITRSPSRSSIFTPPDPEDARRVREMERAAEREREERERERAPGSGPKSILKKTQSRGSIGSRKEYARFNSAEYVDPAVMASGRSVLLPLPNEAEVGVGASSGVGPEIPVMVKGKKTKAKGKGKKK